MEKFGNSGGDNDSERLEIGIDVSLSQDGSQTGIRVKICDKATEAAVRDSKDFERRYGIILGANQ